MANLLSTWVSGSLTSTGRITTTYNTDRYQFNLSRTSGSNWWFTNDSDKLGLHLNNVGDRIYFATDGNIWSSYYNDWLSNVLANKISTSGGQTIAGITYFSNSESLQVYGIRGRFTNEYIHLYHKVGIGNPNGWGVGEGSTPGYGLSTYGGIVVAYGNNATSSFNGHLRIDRNWGLGDYSGEQFTIRGTYPSIALRSTNHNSKWLIHNADRLQFYYGGTVDDNNWANKFEIPTDGNIWMAWANDYISNLLGAKQNASTAITTSNIGSQSVSYANSAGDASTLGGYGRGNTTNKIAYWDSTRNLYVDNPESYSGEVRLGAAWNRGGVYASNTLSLSTSASQIHFVFSNNTTAYIDSNGHMYAAIYYDSQNSAFYVNPNGYSNLSQVNTNELFIDDQKVLNAVAGNGATGTINAVWGLLKPNGKKIYPDEEFANGTNSVNIYNNNGGSAVSIVRKNSGFVDSSAANMPNKTGYVLEIMHAPTTSYGTSPGYGGWYFATWTAPSSSRLLCIFKMKVPAGRYLNWASNSIGSGGNGEWLTSNAGTGQYQDYAYLVHSGTSSFSSTHFFFITGGSSDTFYTYLASATVYDVTDVSEDFVFRQTASADMRAPIFYDSQDLGYYVDPNATSNLAVVNVSTINPTNTYVGNAIYFGGGNNYLNWTDSRIYSNVAIQGAEVYTAGWFRANGHQGLYNPTNNAHFYPNNASYGSWRIDGSRNGWVGLHFESGSTLMMNSSETGIHREGYGWQFRWYNGSMFVSRGTYGGGTEYTIIDSGTIGSQSVNYANSAGAVAWSNVSSKPATWLNEPNLIQGSEPDTIRTSGFFESYQGSGNPTGTWMNYINVRHSNTNNGHGFQIGMSYYDNNLWFRSYSGNIPPSFQSWSRALGTNTDPYPSNMNQYVRTTDDVTHNSTTSPTFLVNNHSDNTKGYRIHNTSGSSVSAMFTNSSNQLVIAAGAVDQINLNKKVYVNGVALGVNVTPSATAGRIDASNDIVAYSSSDERLKHNIAPIENALDKVKSLTGVEFDWKPEYKHAHGYEGHDTGIIAQQVEAVMPSAVRTNDTGFLAVRYEKLIGLLIEGMKEQQAQIDELKAKLDGLTK